MPWDNLDCAYTALKRLWEPVLDCRSDERDLARRRLAMEMTRRGLEATWSLVSNPDPAQLTDEAPDDLRGALISYEFVQRR
jgi:hypothetical protein